MKYVFAFVFCIFMGCTGISLGIGTVVPSINLVAKPFVCPDGAMEASISSRKGTGKNRNATYSKANWTCEDAKGNVEPISLAAVTMIAGPFYGVLLFLPLALLLAIVKRRPRAGGVAGPAPTAGGYGPGPGYGPGAGPGQGPPQY